MSAPAGCQYRHCERSEAIRRGYRHCERSEAIQRTKIDCFVACNDWDGNKDRLLRRFTPRNDGDRNKGGSLGRVAPRHDGDGNEGGLLRRFAPRNDGDGNEGGLLRRFTPRNDGDGNEGGLLRRFAPRNDGRRGAMKNPAVYIMANQRNGTIYTGVTSNIIQRIWQHKEGIGSRFTAQYQCKLLVYYELHATMENAISREKQIKGGSRAKKRVLIEQLNPDWKDLYEKLI